MADNLLLKSDLKYLGGFKISYHSDSVSRTGFSDSRFVVSDDETKCWLTGNNTFMSICQYSIPALVNTTDQNAMNSTGAPVQGFSSFTDRITDIDSGDNTRSFANLSMVNGKIYATTYDPYNTTGPTENMFVVENPNDLANSTVRGYMSVSGADYASGWINPIPAEHQAALGGDYLIGNARRASINGRWSMGPSAYSFNVADLEALQTSQTLNTTMLLKYDLSNRLDSALQNSNSFNYNIANDPVFCPAFSYAFQHDDWGNHYWRNECVGDNDVWTEISNAQFGVIVPGTNTYIVFGDIGGVRRGMGYKIYQTNSETGVTSGGLSSGETAFDATDQDEYVWLYDVQDLIDVRNNVVSSHEPFPYEYGRINYPIEGRGISDACYIEATNRLYISLRTGGESAPIVLVYEFIKDRPKAPTNVSGGLNLTWDAPTLRVDGSALTVAGYEIRCRAGKDIYENDFVFQTTNTNYTLDPIYATCKISVAAYDANGKYSEFISNGAIPTGRSHGISSGGVIE